MAITKGNFKHNETENNQKKSLSSMGWQLPSENLCTTE